MKKSNINGTGDKRKVNPEWFTKKNMDESTFR